MGSSACTSPPYLRPAIKAVALAIVGLLLVRLIWGWHGSYELNSRLAALREAKQPVSLGDLQNLNVPDEENAAIYLDRAARIKQKEIPERGMSTRHLLDGGSFAFAPSDFFSESVKPNRPALALLRQSRQYTRVDVKIEYTERSGVQATLAQNFGTLARIAARAAIDAHQRRDDRAAIEYVRDLLHIGRVSAYMPQLFSYDTSTTLPDLLAARVTFLLGSNLEIGDSPTQVPEAQVRELINQLLGDHITRHLQQVLASERATMTEASKIDGTWMIRPIEQRDTIRLLSVMDAAIRAAEEPTLEQAIAILDTAPPHETLTNLRSDYSIRHALLPQTLSLFDQALRSKFQLDFDTRCAAVALATRLFQHEHGRWPESMDELAGKYLPRIPNDPLAPKGPVPIRYALIRDGRPDGGDRPIAYSVMSDGIDDTSAGAMSDPFGRYSLANPEGLDEWRDLSAPHLP